MTTKLLIFALLGTILILSVSSRATEDQEPNSNSWWQAYKDLLKKQMEKLKKTFEDVISEQGPKIKELGKEKLAEMAAVYGQLQSQATEAIDKERKLWDERIEQWKKDGGEALEDGKEKLEELKKQAEAALQNQTTYWSGKLQEWEQSVKEAVAKVEESINDC